MVLLNKTIKKNSVIKIKYNFKKIKYTCVNLNEI